MYMENLLRRVTQNLRIKWKGDRNVVDDFHCHKVAFTRLDWRKRIIHQRIESGLSNQPNVWKNLRHPNRVEIYQKCNRNNNNNFSKMYYDGTLKKDIKFPPGSRLENSTNGPSFKPFFRRSNNYIDGRGYKSVSDHFTLRGKVFHIVRPSSLGPHKHHGSALSAVCLLSGHEMAANTTLSFDEFPTSCYLFRHF